MATLEIGQKAPDFVQKINMVKTVHLSDFKGKKVILYFIQKTIHQAAPRRPAIQGQLSVFEKRWF